MKTVCNKENCTGCMACLDICPKKAITVVDHFSYYSAHIDEDKCIKCGLCENVCQIHKPLVKEPPKSWFQGWNNNVGMRSKSSSGGIATAIAKGFIEQGGSVCSCEFTNGKFIFSIADKIEELERFIGSKYVKSNPQNIYKEIKKSLINGRKILVIALPCQIAAVKNYLQKINLNNLYTIDLICHGTPSPRMLSEFLKQYNYELNDIKNISFRKSNNYQVKIFSNNYPSTKSRLEKGNAFDKYSLSFLNALNFTENCYNCAYACKNRVSDLSLGDSWGSSLSKNEKKKGISLALCMNEKGDYLLNIGNIHLEEVDIDTAVRNNHQLQGPCKKPINYSSFFNDFKKGYNYNKIVFKHLPKQCLKQDMKSILTKFL